MSSISSKREDTEEEEPALALALVGEAVVVVEEAVVEEAVVELAYNMMADTEEHRMERMTPHMDSLKKKREMIY